MTGSSFLTRMWPGFLQARIESGGGSFECLQAHCPRDISDMSKTLRAQDRQSPHGMHRLCAIKQGEPFLCLQMHRLEPSQAQRFAALHPLALKKRFAFADHAQREMSQWGEIAAGTDRSFFRNDGAEAVVKHLTEHFDDPETNAAQTQNKNIGTEQHHRPDLRLRKRIANAASVTADKI